MTAPLVWDRHRSTPFIASPGPHDDKYSRGVVALRTGSVEFPGAAVLGVEAAWRAGAGFVRYLGPSRAAEAVLARRPETVLGTASARVDAWVIGSGTDPSRRTDHESATLQEILQGEVPVVADAGALEVAARAPAPRVLTPHAGEFARLASHLGLAVDVQDHRVEAARELAGRTGAVVAVKGAVTVVASPDGTARTISEGPGWLATAGTGDVLAGVLGTLIASNRAADLGDVAAAAVWLHGRAARIASGAVSGPGHPIVALDVAAALPLVVGELLA